MKARFTSPKQNSPLMFDHTLYCEEENWDDNNIEITQQDAKNVEYFEQDLLWDDEELSSLLYKEQENELYSGLEENPFLVQYRCESVDWMLKVVGYYSFSSLTAVLAVNYMDRFMYTFDQFREKKKPWMSQLAAVACLSLAAKVEETRVPLLLDLQVEDCKYFFESKTIQRMEIFILSTLEWKMNPATPISFLDHIARRLGLEGCVCKEFMRRCEFLILSTVSDCRFMSYLPSALATATMLYVISSMEPRIGVEYQDQLIHILGVDREKVEDCCKLIQEVATSVDFYSNSKRKFGLLPGSPKGVMDVSFSSSTDSLNDSLWAMHNTIASGSSSPAEPLSKKIKKP